MIFLFPRWYVNSLEGKFFFDGMFFLWSATSKAVSAASLLHARRASSKKVAIARRAEEKGSVQQLLGMKGAGETDDTPLWKNLGPIRYST